MKVQPRNADGFCKNPTAGIIAVLVYGPDTGLVRERGQALSRAIVSDLQDPFRVSELKADQISGDGARLNDEMAAMALTGGRRLVRVRDADESVTVAFQALLKQPPSGDTLCVVEAGDLGKSSKLRALFESDDKAAAIACYVEEEGELAVTIGRILGEHKLTIDTDARDWLAANLVGDRAVARGEVDKLAIYMMGASRVTLEDVRTVIGDSAALDMDEPALAAADGDIASIDRALGRLFAEGTSPVPILRSAQRHFQRLQMAVYHTTRGQTAQQAVKALRPPVFFKMENQVTNQVRRWNLPNLALALDRLMDAEADCKRTNMPDETLCARAFFQVAQLARRSGG
ncbi:DNA polymerase III subunit delta [Nitrospirillum bahiense]|uniref:DNA-directed DNA polymerase n=1 Tax=Nitrospirillum amazonense TaxID=28077 RepID=A0A560EX16_9PROT|nr:DNA polymerase III subunit delta [Nitrospirillum amazonense]TWB13922.1 DNA polymerase III delta subunit [Nitrospirillum amazonense]